MNAQEVLNSFCKIKHIQHRIVRTKGILSQKVKKLFFGKRLRPSYRQCIPKILLKKKNDTTKYIPIFTDSRKFEINLNINIFTYSYFEIKITESLVLIKGPGVSYQGSDGLSLEDYFNISLHMHLPEVVMYDEVLKLRNSLKKNQKKRIYNLYLDSDFKLVRGPEREKRFNKKL